MFRGGKVSRFSRMARHAIAKLLRRKMALFSLAWPDPTDLIENNNQKTSKIYFEADDVKKYMYENILPAIDRGSLA